MIMDPYKVLGVEPCATKEEIRSAYRARVRDAHPDRTGGDRHGFAATIGLEGDDAQENMRRIIDARDLLLDDTARAAYDEHAANDKEPGTAPNLGDVLTTIEGFTGIKVEKVVEHTADALGKAIAARLRQIMRRS